MSQLFRKERSAEADTANVYKPIQVVPSACWLMYLGGALIVTVLIVWLCVGWLVETANVTGLYHPGAAKDGEVICFVPLTTAKTIRPGMEATVSVTGYNQQKYGHMKAQVSYVDSYVTSLEEMRMLLQDELLVSTFTKNGPVAAVVCKLTEDPDTVNGYLWSGEKGGSLLIQDGSFVTVSVAVSESRPMALAMPALNELFTR